MSNFEINCPCRGEWLEVAFTYDARPHGETVFDLGEQAYRRSYNLCHLCGHWFGSHSLDLSDLYSEKYVESTYGDELARTFERIIALPDEHSDNSGRSKRIHKYAREYLPLSQAPSLLDVGSGLGVFPWAMKEKGWICTALDPSPQSCEHIRSKVGIEVIEGDFFSLDLEAVGQFDVVTFNKVLEHVENPCEMLRLALPLVKPGGFVYIEVPDASTAALHGPSREEFFIEHHHGFSMASLCLTIERAGLHLGLARRLVDPSSKFTLESYAHPYYE